MKALVNTRVLGIPVPFLSALVVVVLFTIFLGAWAVSADAGSDQRNFYFGVGGPGVNVRSADLPAEGTATSSEGGAGSTADTWWGSALLKACPFH